MSRKTPDYAAYASYDEREALEKLESGEWDEFKLYVRPTDLPENFRLGGSTAECWAYQNEDGSYKFDESENGYCEILDWNLVKEQYEGVIAVELDLRSDNDRQSHRYHIRIWCYKVTRLSEKYSLTPLETFFRRESGRHWRNYREVMLESRDLRERGTGREENRSDSEVWYTRCPCKSSEGRQKKIADAEGWWQV